MTLEKFLDSHHQKIYLATATWQRVVTRLLVFIASSRASSLGSRSLPGLRIISTGPFYFKKVLQLY